MARGLDHIVHAVRDLDAAAGLYRRLGFQVGSRNRHPRAWGTQNHIVQLPGTFIELLTVADTTGIAPHAPRFFSFGAFNRDFLARGEGLAMLVLEGRGAPDADEFRARRHRRFRALRVRARGQAPRRHAVKVAFALAFAADPRRPTPASSPASTAIRRASGIRRSSSIPTPRRGRRRGSGRRESRATITSSSSLHRRARGAGDLGRHRHQDAARRDPGDGARRLPRPFRHRAAATGRGARLAALRFAVRDLEAVGRSLRAENLAQFQPDGTHRGRPGRRHGRDAGVRADLSVDPAAFRRQKSARRIAMDANASFPTPS